jgi:hypothetical protein
MEKTITEQRMSIIFNEWLKRYSETPDEFSELLDENGQPFEDYGDNATAYFIKIADELDEQNKLPRP